MSLVSAIKAPLSISNAIRKASQATGTDFSYLLKTAARESAFKTSAKAKTSSATGLFQFIESTWLKTVKEAGNKFGLNKYTPHIFKTQSGRHYVPNQKLRTEILQLRNNPEISAVMAGAFTQKNSEFIVSELGRNPTQGELYIAHFLGPKGASDLISLAEKNPNARADRYFPRAARANKPIFYTGGRPLTVAQVYNELVSDYAKSQDVAASPSGVSPKPATASTAVSTITTPAPEPVKQAARASERVPEGLFRVSALQSNVEAGSQASIVQNAVTGRPGGANVKGTVGLLGQKGSPIAAMTRVASLTQSRPATSPETLSDAVPGSIGVWTTNVRFPAVEAAGAEPNAKRKEEDLAPVRRRTAKSRQSPRPDRLLEVSAKRNASPASIRTVSAADAFNAPNFWDQMALNGN